MEIDFQALMATFVAETEEGLATLEERLVALERRPDDAEALGEIFRVIHTLKGDAGTLGFSLLADFAHRLEDPLEALRAGEIQAGESLVSLLLEAVDVLRGMLANAAEGIEEVLPAHRRLLERLAAEAAAPGARAAQRGEASAGVEAPAPREAAPPAEREAKTLRVEVAKLDALLNLTGEIGIARSRLTQMLEDREVEREAILELHREADRLFAHLQELALQVRMVPIGPTFRHHVRTVRDLARSLGKEALLVIEGADTPVDTAVIEHLRDPLTHMVRNALDHGIERPDERMEKGKDPRGRITLKAYHDAGSLVVELADDGAGLDRERIRARARSRGLAGEGMEPSDPALEQLIFEPGFSTAEAVTGLSGRGIGLDVVRRNVEALRGSLGIASRPGEGTRITLRLPLTLALIEGLRVGVGRETFILPLEAVVESLELPANGRSHGRMSGVVTVRGKSLPYLRLRRLFACAGAAPARENLVVVRYAGDWAGLVVDALYGQSQTVIKPLGKVFRDLAGFSGSAILGNGEVALILDVPRLLERGIRSLARNRPGREPRPARLSTPSRLDS